MKTRWMKRHLAGVPVLGAAFLAFGLNSCFWDSKTFDDFVGKNGLVKCDELAAVVMLGGTVCKSNGECSCELGFSDCDENTCAAKCAADTRLPQAFISNICPANYYCDKDRNECRVERPFVCENHECNQDKVCENKDDRCGVGCLNCSETANASKGSCDVKEGVCIITECAPGYHQAKRGDGTIQCALNTFKDCGKRDDVDIVNCETTLNATRGSCSAEGDCIATLCKTGFHLNVGKCDANSPNACGSVHTQCGDIFGWAEGRCDNGPPAQCVATKCRDSFCLQKGICADGRGNSFACGTDGGACDNCREIEGDLKSCADGECITTGCSTTECYDYAGSSPGCVNTATKCGPSCSNCQVEGAVGECKEGKCEITCSKGYHLVESIGTFTCAEDRVDACGSSTNDCNQVPGWGGGRCEDGKCFATSCLQGHHLAGGEQGLCTEDTVTSCGTHITDCTKLIEGWVEGTCELGQCQPSKCKSEEGYCVNDDGTGQKTCAKGASNVNACGINGLACQRCTGHNEDCISGECVVVECSATKACPPLRGWNVKCNSGKCAYAPCEGTYTLQADKTCKITCKSNLCKVGEHCGGNGHCECTVGSNNGCSSEQVCCVRQSTSGSSTSWTYSCQSATYSGDEYFCPPPL